MHVDVSTSFVMIGIERTPGAGGVLADTRKSSRVAAITSTGELGNR
jgi:hypothetical protein